MASASVLCTAIFSVLDAVVLQPLPYAHFERLIAVWETSRGWNRITGPSSARRDRD